MKKIITILLSLLMMLNSSMMVYADGSEIEPMPFEETNYVEQEESGSLHIYICNEDYQNSFVSNIDSNSSIKIVANEKEVVFNNNHNYSGEKFYFTGDGYVNLPYEAIKNSELLADEGAKLYLNDGETESEAIEFNLSKANTYFSDFTVYESESGDLFVEFAKDYADEARAVEKYESTNTDGCFQGGYIELANGDDVIRFQNTSIETSEVNDNNYLVQFVETDDSYRLIIDTSNLSANGVTNGITYNVKLGGAEYVFETKTVTFSKLESVPTSTVNVSINEEGDLVISCADEAFLRALAKVREYGQSGQTSSGCLSINNNSENYYFENSRYVDYEGAESQITYIFDEESKTVIIPKKMLINKGVVDGNYNIYLHADGYCGFNAAENFELKGYGKAISFEINLSQENGDLYIRPSEDNQDSQAYLQSLIMNKPAADEYEACYSYLEIGLAGENSYYRFNNENDNGVLTYGEDETGHYVKLAKENLLSQGYGDGEYEGWIVVYGYGRSEKITFTLAGLTIAVPSYEVFENGDGNFIVRTLLADKAFIEAIAKESVWDEENQQYTRGSVIQIGDEEFSNNLNIFSDGSNYFNEIISTGEDSDGIHFYACIFRNALIERGLTNGIYDVKISAYGYSSTTTSVKIEKGASALDEEIVVSFNENNDLLIRCENSDFLTDLMNPDIYNMRGENLSSGSSIEICNNYGRIRLNNSTFNLGDGEQSNQYSYKHIETEEDEYLIIPAKVLASWNLEDGTYELAFVTSNFVCDPVEVELSGYCVEYEGSLNIALDENKNLVISTNDKDAAALNYLRAICADNNEDDYIIISNRIQMSCTRNFDIDNNNFILDEENYTITINRKNLVNYNVEDGTYVVEIYALGYLCKEVSGVEIDGVVVESPEFTAIEDENGNIVITLDIEDKAYADLIVGYSKYDERTQENISGTGQIELSNNSRGYNLQNDIYIDYSGNENRYQEIIESSDDEHVYLTIENAEIVARSISNGTYNLTLVADGYRDVTKEITLTKACKQVPTYEIYDDGNDIIVKVEDEYRDFAEAIAKFMVQDECNEISENGGYFVISVDGCGHYINNYRCINEQGEIYSERECITVVDGEDGYLYVHVLAEEIQNSNIPNGEGTYELSAYGYQLETGEIVIKSGCKQAPEFEISENNDGDIIVKISKDYLSYVNALTKVYDDEENIIGGCIDVFPENSENGYSFRNQIEINYVDGQPVEETRVELEVESDDDYYYVKIANSAIIGRGIVNGEANVVVRASGYQSVEKNVALAHACKALESEITYEIVDGDLHIICADLDFLQALVDFNDRTKESFFETGIELYDQDGYRFENYKYGDDESYEEIKLVSEGVQTPYVVIEKDTLKSKGVQDGNYTFKLKAYGYAEAVINDVALEGYCITIDAEKFTAEQDENYLYIRVSDVDELIGQYLEDLCKEAKYENGRIVSGGDIYIDGFETTGTSVNYVNNGYYNTYEMGSDNKGTYIRIKNENLIESRLETGKYNICLSCFGYTNVLIENVDIAACVDIEAEVKLTYQDGKVVIECEDEDYIKAFKYKLNNCSSEVFYVGYRNEDGNDCWSFVSYDQNTAIVSEDNTKVTFNSIDEIAKWQNVPSGQLYFEVSPFGYNTKTFEGYTFTNELEACPEIEISQNKNGDIVISADNDYLKALAATIEESNIDGYKFVAGGRVVINYYDFCNRIDKDADYTYEVNCLKFEGDNLIIPVEALIEQRIENGECDIELKALGYEAYIVNSFELENLCVSNPEDLEISIEYKENTGLIITSNNEDFLKGLLHYNDEFNVAEIYIYSEEKDLIYSYAMREDYECLVYENGKITIPEEFIKADRVENGDYVVCFMSYKFSGSYETRVNINHSYAFLPQIVIEEDENGNLCLSNSEENQDKTWMDAVSEIKRYFRVDPENDDNYIEEEISLKVTKENDLLKISNSEIKKNKLLNGEICFLIQADGYADCDSEMFTLTKGVDACPSDLLAYGDHDYLYLETSNEDFIQAVKNKGTIYITSDLAEENVKIEDIEKYYTLDSSLFENNENKLCISKNLLVDDQENDLAGKYRILIDNDAYTYANAFVTLFKINEIDKLILGQEFECSINYDSEDVVWSVSNEDIATINQNGLLTALAKGSVYVIATIGKFTDKYEVTIANKEVQTLSFASTAITKTYGDSEFSQTVNGAKTSVTYTSSDDTVATINSTTGKVTILKAGTTTITATAAESATYAEASTTYTLTVNKAKVDLPSAEKNLIYSGEEQIGVKSASDKYTLTNNKQTNAGSYTAVATLNEPENYEWASLASSIAQDINWSIDKKEIKVKADNKSSQINADLVELTYTADKLCGDDEFTGSLATNAKKNQAGEYDITQGSLALSDNYTIKFTNGTYKVKDLPELAIDSIRISGDYLFIKADLKALNEIVEVGNGVKFDHENDEYDKYISNTADNLNNIEIANNELRIKTKDFVNGTYTIILYTNSYQNVEIEFEITNGINVAPVGTLLSENADGDLLISSDDSYLDEITSIVDDKGFELIDYIVKSEDIVVPYVLVNCLGYNKNETITLTIKANNYVDKQLSVKLTKVDDVTFVDDSQVYQNNKVSFAIYNAHEDYADSIQSVIIKRNNQMIKVEEFDTENGFANFDCYEIAEKFTNLKIGEEIEFVVFASGYKVQTLTFALEKTPGLDDGESLYAKIIWTNAEEEIILTDGTKTIESAQIGDIVEVKMYCMTSENMEELDARLFSISNATSKILEKVEGTTNSYKVIAAGTGKINIVMKANSSKKYTCSVKTAARLIERIDAYLIDDGTYDYSYNASEYIGQKLDINVKCYDKLAEIMETSNYSFTVSDTSIAKIVTEDGQSKLQILKAGQVVVTCTSKDTNKKSCEFIVRIKDYTPSLAANSLTINRNLTDIAAQLNAYSMYESKIVKVSLKDVEDFDLSYDENKHVIVFEKNTNTASLANKSTYKYTLVITVDVDGNELTQDDQVEFEYAISIKIADAEASITSKVSGKLDTFNPSKSTLSFTLTSKDAVIEAVDEGDFADTMEFVDEGNGTYTINVSGIETDEKGKFISSGNILVYCKGYDNPKAVTLKFSTATTSKPSYKLETSSYSLYAASKQIKVRVLDSKTKALIDINEEELEVSLDSSIFEYSGFDSDTSTIILTRKGGVEACAAENIVLSLKNDEWTSAIELKIKTSIVTKDPTINSLTITLNNKFAQEKEADITSSIAGIDLDYSASILTPAKEVEGLEVEVNNGRIFAKVDERVKAGSYKYTLSGVSIKDEEIILKNATITIKVEDKEPTVKYLDVNNKSLTSVTLNTIVGEVITLTPSLTNNTYNAEISDIECTYVGTAEEPDIEFSYGANELTITCGEDVAAGTYKYQLTTIYGNVKAAKATSFSVKVINKAPTVKLTIKNKLNPLAVNTAITATAKISNLTNEVLNDVATVVIYDAEGYESEYLTGEVVDGILNIYIKPESVEKITSNLTLKNLTVNLDLKNTGVSVTSDKFTVSITASAPTVKLTSSTLNIYNTSIANEIVARTALNITKVEAEINVSEFELNEELKDVNEETGIAYEFYLLPETSNKSNKAFATYLVVGKLDDEVVSYEIAVVLLDGSKVKAKSSTTLKYTFTYVGDYGTKQKTTNISFKVVDKSTAIKK